MNSIDDESSGGEDKGERGLADVKCGESLHAEKELKEEGNSSSELRDVKGCQSLPTVSPKAEVGKFR